MNWTRSFFLLLASAFGSHFGLAQNAIPAHYWSEEQDLERSFFAARAKDIRAAVQPQFRAFLDRAANSDRKDLRIWALTRILEAGDTSRFEELSRLLVQEVRETAINQGPSVSSVYRPPQAGLPQSIHPLSPFYRILENTVRNQPELAVPEWLYVIWCYNTQPDQRALIHEIARNVKAPLTLSGATADPWKDPRFWILTDWALAWGEPEDFVNLPQQMKNMIARRAFNEIASTVTRIPGFFTCRNDVETASPAVDGHPVQVWNPFNHLRVTHQPTPPRYPEQARNRGLMANLKVILKVDATGKVCGAHCVPGPFLAFFAPTAVEYASRWTFDPARIGEQPVDSKFMLTMPFKIRK